MPKVQTVLGEIDVDQLGLTLCHEHIFLDLSYYWSGEPKEITQRALFSQPVSLENRREVIYSPWAFKDNTVLDDIDSAITEVRAFMGYGGKSIVDVTAYGPMGRDPVALRYVAGVSGANIVMASGRYSEPSMSEKEKARSLEDVEKTIVDEFIHGVDGTGIKPGVLKAAFAGELDKQSELNTLRAVARAQRRIGCALNCHPNIWKCESHRILDMIQEEGADLNKVVLSHQDFTGEHWEYQDSLAKRGAYIEFDTFGCECVADPLDKNVWFRSDGQKIEFVKKQIALGNVERILLSGDMCLKLFFTKWGGWGYAHLPKNIFPRMRAAGITDEQLHIMAVENPKRVFGH